MNIAAILLFLRPGEQWSINNNDYAQLIWISLTPKPSFEQITSVWPTVQQKIGNDQINLQIQNQINQLVQQYSELMAEGDPNGANKLTQQIKDLIKSKKEST